MCHVCSADRRGPLPTDKGGTKCDMVRLGEGTRTSLSVHIPSLLALSYSFIPSKAPELNCTSCCVESAQAAVTHIVHDAYQLLHFVEDKLLIKCLQVSQLLCALF